MAKSNETWVTINGNHVCIDSKSGKITKGPDALKGKTVAEASKATKSGSSSSTPKKSTTKKTTTTKKSSEKDEEEDKKKRTTSSRSRTINGRNTDASSRKRSNATSKAEEAKKAQKSKSTKKNTKSSKVKVATVSTYKYNTDGKKGSFKKTSTRSMYMDKKELKNDIEEGLSTANRLAKGTGGTVPKSVKDFNTKQKDLYNYLLGIGMTPSEAKWGVIDTVKYQNSKNKKK